MFGIRTIHRHAALMNRMAEVNGVDLTEAMKRGALQAEEWRDAVVLCTGCRDPEACLHRLAAYAGAEVTGTPAPAEGAPEFCANRAMIARLAAEMAPGAGVAVGGAAPASRIRQEEAA